MKYAIFSDIHANTEALSVALNKCNELGVNKYLCLGDIVGYNSNPKECLDIMRSLDIAGVVKGNHDEYVSNNDEVMEGFNPYAKQAVLWTKAQLDQDDLDWLANLPLKTTIREANITLVHATLDTPDAWGYIFDTHHAADNFSYQFTQLCFCGHSHIPVTFCKKPITLFKEQPIEIIDSWGDSGTNYEESHSISLEIKTGYKYLINIGSVGQPRNHDPRTSFAVYDDETQLVTRYMLPYDIGATQAKIIEAGLPEKLAFRLEHGN